MKLLQAVHARVKREILSDFTNLNAEKSVNLSLP